MEETSIQKTHKVLIHNRKTGNISGVLDVLSFDVAQILLETEQGMLMIKGRDLHVNRVNLEKGEVDLDGLVQAIEYSEVPKTAEKASSLMGRLFR